MILSVVASQAEGDSPSAERGVIVFPQGLVGCESWRRFVLQDDPDGGPVKLLQNLDDPSVGLLVIDPCLLVANYEVDLSEADARLLKLNGAAAVVYCTLTVREQPARITANLLGPLVINPSAGLGKQLVLANSGYSVQHPVLLAKEGPEAQADGRRTH